jgi:hypothetical protein
MPRFEVFSPAAPPARASAVTLRVDAEHWLAALKAGLQRLGAPELTSNVLCDIQEDGSIHVTDPRGGGVFRIAELRGDAGAAAVPASEVGQPATARGPRPSGQPDRVEEVARPSTPPPERIGRRIAASAQDVLSELSARVADLGSQRDRAAGLGFLLDLAMEHVGADAGSVFLAVPGAEALAVEVARGPRAKELLALRAGIPLGMGIVGFCAEENLCLAVSDAEKDARFLGSISAAIGYETRSVLCAPIARGATVLGALEVINKRGGAPFGHTDLVAVAYLARQAARLLERFDP